MAKAATPTVVDASGDASPDNVTGRVTSFMVNQAIAQDDVTTLDADLDGFATRFIAALSNATGNMNCLWEAPTGAFLLFLNAIRLGNLHPAGRSKTDIIYDPFGTASGNLRFKFTLFFTTIPLTGELAKTVGGQVAFQVDGPVTLTTVP